MTPGSTWRRRVVAMAIVGFVAAVPITLLVRDDGGGDGDAAPTVPSEATVASQPRVGPGVEDRGLGIRYRVPGKWKESKRASAVRLTSPDTSAEVVVAAPAPADDANRLLKQTLDAFKSEYQDVEIAPGSGRKVGGLEAKGAVVQASRGDQELRILVAVAAGEKRAYLVEVFTIASVRPKRLREAQAALNSLKFKE